MLRVKTTFSIRLLALAFALALFACSKPAAKDEFPADMAQELKNDCDHVFPKYQESYFFKTKLSGEPAPVFFELRGLSAEPIHEKLAISQAEELNGVTERYRIHWGQATSFRFGKFDAGTPPEVEWSEWKEPAKEGGPFYGNITKFNLEILRKGGVIEIVYFPDFYDPNKGQNIKWVEDPLEFDEAELKYFLEE
jgi:hypothetical protein